MPYSGTQQLVYYVHSRSIPLYNAFLVQWCQLRSLPVLLIFYDIGRGRRWRHWIKRCCISLSSDCDFVWQIIALWWWFCPCRVGGAVWNHTAWLFPLMPLPTLSLFNSYFLSGNKYRKNITCKNIGQFQFCINLLPLEFIWRSASCPRHWNQRWFGDAAFTIPSGKQWDHMSPWPPSWLSAGIDECCRSANESGHQW